MNRAINPHKSSHFPTIHPLALPFPLLPRPHGVGRTGRTNLAVAPAELDSFGKTCNSLKPWLFTTRIHQT